MSDITPCPKCGTNHDGYPPDTHGAQVRCIRAQAQALGAQHLVDQVDAMENHRLQRLKNVLRRVWNQ